MATAHAIWWWPHRGVGVVDVRSRHRPGHGLRDARLSSWSGSATTGRCALGGGDMPPEELTLILKLRDEATKQLKSVRGTVTAVGTAMATVGLKVGADWAAATKTIVDGTGATGPALQQLQTDFQAVAKHGEPAATAIADLNTHLGLVGPELVAVADAALMMGVNTSSLGSVLEQTGGSVEDHLQLMNDLTVASQATRCVAGAATRYGQQEQRPVAGWRRRHQRPLSARNRARAGVRTYRAPRRHVGDHGGG